MALRHAESGEIVDLRPLGPRLRQAQSEAIFRSDRIEVMRLVLIDGKEIPEHAVDGPVTFHCIEGTVELSASGARRLLNAGSFVYLAGSVPYTLKAIDDASLLMTVVRC